MKANPNMSRLHKLSTIILSIIIPTSSPMIFNQIGHAQERSQPADQSKEDIATLKRDVNTLQEELRQILNQLNELRASQIENNGNPLTLPAVLLSKVDVHGQPSRGKGTARVAIIEYADFECPYCGEYERKTFPQILSDYIETGKVKYFYRDLPLPMHARALPAARAARCAGEQGKYWEMHDSLFAKQNALSPPAVLDRAQTLGLDKEKFTECLSSEKYTADIEKSVSEAQKMGIDGTPTFFLGVVEPNGDVTIKERLQGAVPFDAFKAQLDTLLASNGHEAVSTH